MNFLIDREFCSEMSHDNRITFLQPLVEEQGGGTDFQFRQRQEEIN